MISLQTACVQVLDTLDKQVLFLMITNQIWLLRNYTVIMAVQKFETVCARARVRCTTVISSKNQSLHVL